MNVSSRPLDEAPGAPRLGTLETTSISRRISAARAGLLMVQLRLTRLRNRMRLGGAESARSAGARRAVRASRASWRTLVLMLAVGLPILTGYGVMLGRFLPWVYERSPHGVVATASAHLAVSMFGALLLGLGLSNKDLNRLDGDMEWLLTLPASIPLIYTIKVAERTLLDIYAWLQIYPLVLAMVTHGHFSWLGPAQALLLSLPLSLLVALAYVIVECGARVWLPKVAINNLQLVCTVAGLALLISIPTRPHWVAPLASLPWPAVAQAVGLAFSGTVTADIAPVWRLLRFCLETAALVGGGYLLLLHISSRGAVIGAGAALGRRGNGLQRLVAA